MIGARRCERIGTRFRGEEQLLDVGLPPPLQLSPLVDRHQHGGLHAPLGHDLWSFRQAPFQELAEACFGGLYLPSSAHMLPTRNHDDQLSD